MRNKIKISKQEALVVIRPSGCLESHVSSHHNAMPFSTKILFSVSWYNYSTCSCCLPKRMLSQAIWLRFLRSLGSIIGYEANEINQLREERPSRRACSRAAFGCTRAAARARMHSLSYQGSSRTKVVRWLTRQFDLRAGHRPGKTQCRRESQSFRRFS